MARLAQALGVAAVVLGLSKIHAAEIGHYDFTGSGRLAWALSYVGLLIVATYAVGLPDQVPPSRAWLFGLVAAMTSAIGMSILQLLLGDALLPRFVVFVTILIVPVVAVLTSLLARQANLNGMRGDRVVSVVAVVETERLRADLLGAELVPAILVAALDVEQVIGDSSLISRTVAEQEADVIMLGRSALARPEVVSMVAELHERGVRVRSLVDFYEEWVGKLPVPELEQSSLMFDIKEIHGGSYARLSRLLDISVAAVGLVGLVVVTPVVILGNLIANRGPLFFKQARVGKGNTEFTMLKFRSMAPGTNAGEWTTEGDERVTPFGRVLRATHLDELPQVLNILRGELSTVGPRPEQPSYAESLTEAIPFYRFRHVVRPGLTGWAQVNYRYGSDEFDALEKLQYEFWYLRNQSIWLDLGIIVRTLRSVAGRGGR